MNNRTFTLDGKQYDSLLVAAEAYGVSPTTIRRWLSFGDKSNPHPSGNAKSCTIDGMTFPSTLAAANYFHVTCKVVARWLERGDTSHPPREERRYNKKPVTIDGKDFPSVIDAARAYGVGRKKIDQWRKNGGISTPSVKNEIPVTIDGKEYPSLNAAAKALKVTIHTIHKWEDNGGTSRTIRRGPKGTPVTIDGVQYPSMSAAQLALHVSLDTVKRWLANGGKSIQKSIPVVVVDFVTGKRYDFKTKGGAIKFLNSSCADFGSYLDRRAFLNGMMPFSVPVDDTFIETKRRQWLDRHPVARGKKNEVRKVQLRIDARTVIYVTPDKATPEYAARWREKHEYCAR